MKSSMTRNSLHQPIFVIGSPRSGTSLLRLMLTSHSSIIVPPECGFIVWLYPEFAGWKQTDNDVPEQLTRFLDALMACKKFDTWGLARSSLVEGIRLNKPRDYAELCATVYQVFASANKKDAQVWGDKNNFYLKRLDVIDQIYPHSRFIHIVRDGRDVACSYREVMQQASKSPYAPVLATEVQSIAEEWLDNVATASRFFDALPAERSITIRYEDLVDASQTIMERLATWLGLPYEAAMQDFHRLNRASDLEPALTLDWKRRTLEPVSADTVGRFRLLLSPDEQAQFNRIAETMLMRFRYL